ncbi:chromo domain-containing protein [Tanacetum coccineum]
MRSKRQTKSTTKTKTKTSDLEKPPVQNDEIDVGNEYDEMYGEDFEDYEEEELEKPKLLKGFTRSKLYGRNVFERPTNLWDLSPLPHRFKNGVRFAEICLLIHGTRLNWPESGNTWEPVENLDAVTDLLGAFEERFCVAFCHNSNAVRTDNNAVATVNQPNKTQSVMGSPQAEEIRKTNELDLELSEVRATTSSTNQENKTGLTIHIQEDVGTEDISPENGVSKDGEKGLTRVSLRIGSQRRKTCAVKRFKQSTDSAFTTDVDHAAATPESVEIIKIVKPVNYTTSMENGIEDVCVSLLVRRSDGEEVVVDNKYLKENNPVLLINYYEKHLRYSIS